MEETRARHRYFRGDETRRRATTAPIVCTIHGKQEGLDISRGGCSIIQGDTAAATAFDLSGDKSTGGRGLIAM